jgi:hypothetical protein
MEQNWKSVWGCEMDSTGTEYGPVKTYCVCEDVKWIQLAQNMVQW